MGNYRVTIDGLGAHHGDSPSSADRICADAVAKLARAGHTVARATLVATEPVEHAAPEEFPVLESMPEVDLAAMSERDSDVPA